MSQTATNFALLQIFAAAKLLAEPLLANISIVTLRDIQAMSGGSADDIAKIVAAQTVWATPRNGKLGAGIIIGMPAFKFTSPNAPFVEREMELPVNTYEDPTLNGYGDSKTGMTAEEICDTTDSILHQWAITHLGVSLYGKSRKPDNTFQGVVGYETIYVCEAPRALFTQVATPTIAAATLTVTLACSTAGAAIYYTTDGTFPGPDAATGQPAGTAILYTTPFAVTSGTTVLAAAYKSGSRGSDIENSTIT